VPCLLKLPFGNSPGIVTFNTSEYFSNLFKKKKIIHFLKENKKWIFGVNLSGSYERLKYFPDQDWLSFIMCYSLSSSYLKNIDAKKKIDLCYINFLEIYDFQKVKKYWDICIISRDAKIKRISYTVKLVENLLKKNKNLKILIIVPDSRSLFQKISYKIFSREGYFSLVENLLTNDQKKNIDFISCDTKIFGNHTLSKKTLYKFISESKYVMINSKKEGINRAIIEGLCHGSKAIVHSDLESEINALYLDIENTIFIDDDLERSSIKILNGLRKFNVKPEHINKHKNHFSNINSKEKIKIYFRNLFQSHLLKINGKWYLDNLDQRLCNHGNRGLYSIMYSQKLFFEWFEKIEKMNESFIDEDHMYKNIFVDKPNIFQFFSIVLNKNMSYFKNMIKNIIKF